ncbi:lipocalin family protein [Microbacterium sp. YJN-G]|uniref:lipocalin family protein n=1 Tax=Microbacterium sp. YJN-G TaxID=2763257 RepID=UPI001877C1C4|nr:lipocalin family protein [Microbacterium sp. YJN-G]
MDDGEVRSVPALELGRYLGLWYEIGRLPLRHEDEDARDITAEYTLDDDGTVRVDNRCLDDDGEPTQAVGQGVPDQEHPGRLKVTFLPEALRWIPFTHADYWVLRVDEDYQHALVGTPDRKHLWFLAREAKVTDAVEKDFLATAHEQGFDLDDWVRPEQSGRVVQV